MVPPAAALEHEEKRIPVARAGRLWNSVCDNVGHLSPLLLGRVALIAANAALVLTLARRLPVETYGLFVSAIGAQIVIGKILTLGSDVGMVRLSGSSSNIGASLAEIYSAGLAATIAMSGVALGACLGLWLYLPANGYAGWFSLVVAIGAAGVALIDLAYAYRVSRMEYGRAAAAQSFPAVTRLVCTLTVSSLFPAAEELVFFTYAVATVAAGSFLNLRVIRGVWTHPRWSVIARVVRYSSWAVAATLIANANLHQGTFILLFFGLTAAAGAFGLALTLTLAFFALYVGLSDYVRSRASHLESRSVLPAFAGRWAAACGALALCVIPVAWVIGIALPKIAGPQWGSAVQPFYYLSAGLALHLMYIPVEAAAHYLLKPWIVAFAQAIRLVGAVAIGLRLAQSYGADGAAIAQVGGTALGLMALALTLWLRIRAEALRG